jgi:hypothetical protein
VTLVFTFSDKFAQHDKQIEGLERKYNDLLKQVQQLALASERQAERELWREQVFRQALEIERLKLENERLREQKALPPSSQSTESKEN